MGRDEDIEFIDMPASIRPRYQYITEARMDRLRGVGFTDAFYGLEDAVDDYVTNYLSREDPYL